MQKTCSNTEVASQRYKFAHIGRRRKNDLKAFKYKTNALNYVKPLGLKDDIYEKYITDIIISKELKFDDDKLIGDDNIVNQFRENYSDTFKSADMGELISLTGRWL